MEALGKLNMTVTKAYKVNQSIKFEVFIHKVCLVMLFELEIIFVLSYYPYFIFFIYRLMA